MLFPAADIVNFDCCSRKKKIMVSTGFDKFLYRIFIICMVSVLVPSPLPTSQARVFIPLRACRSHIAPRRHKDPGLRGCVFAILRRLPYGIMLLSKIILPVSLRRIHTPLFDCITKRIAI